ncbi:MULTISPECIES: GNAT family N-acetyltransferase [unclassified Photobacterium]|uniref:GNAT family N-acetyltransferase n=1 Tax=unclassified Photobacterium TaxID=2628852 RepID=UPI000D16E6EF|nr:MULTISPECIES: GNAT family N-acetyltransferase [unclassified Photobacterium]PSV28216.1 GNAT family N-acetyltransferase [Photobacterium sp. GB-56]PSV38818.1 GNAT family N-acetyltransferase [Photobacterium sp. GB-27]PSV40003.1 GNAT family N-acetyltransferase [Photobacterium sp. GB-210]PSV47141.1 GNAT family N-acetyltransferase [Photobacterium sp. GB-36]PSV54609.1 GNAT family N-acetyltransferase [Photobacterium sp. GB-1]
MVDVKIVAFDDANKESIRLVREQVFIKEQQIDPEIEFDGLDTQAVHVLVVDGEQPLGTGRILADGHIGRIAIMKAARGQGLGVKVVQALVNYAKQQGYPRVDLGAQTHAVDFYRKLGFTPYGDEFMEANIPHQAMEQRLNNN